MKRGMAWPIAVVAILAATVAANIWLIRIANADPSFAVEENYYERGVRWDDELAQRALNVRLGWRLSTSLSTIDPGRGANLRIALHDSAARPIAGASMSVRAVHVARAGHPVDVPMRPTTGGDYEGLVPLERAGLWELRVEVVHGNERFTSVERLDAQPSTPR
jgi:nitrogen fixation protein FixH